MAKKNDIPEFGMLRGVKVVNASTVVAGPIAAELMAEMGADVIWIESTKSVDTNRGKGGMGAESDRKNMRNISFDIPSPEGKEILQALLKNADIFLESSKGGTYTKWGLTDEVLWSWNPKLVIAHFSGYGQTGDPEYVNRGCYDPVCQAFSCYMNMQGFKDMEPLPGREIPTDYLAGLSGLANIIAALRWAEKTGKGESFDIAQYEMAIRFQNQRPMDWFNRGVPTGAVGAHNDVTACWGTYKCRDGNYVYLMFLGAGVMEKGLRLFGYEFGSEMFPNTQNFAKVGTCGGDLLEAKVRGLCDNNDAEEVERILCGAGVPCSRVMTYEMAEKHPHYVARDTISEWTAVDGRKLRGVALVPKTKNNPGRIWRGCPTTGQDNDDILAEIGFGQDEIDALYATGTIRKL
ncbi:MAG: crotonobetainyl-CoA--carnitine CoA-transferase [Bacteroidia bacterium]|nr:crotonobetainyl-CoA--carnitine CoA-transferase [Bacteroidia bacterium]